MAEVRYLTADDVLAIADEFFVALGYARPVLRGGGRELLESAIHRAQVYAFYGGVDLASQAAALIQGIAQNQQVTVGNKRVAYAAGVVFLRANGHPLAHDAHDVLAEKIIDLGGSKDARAAHEELATWLEDHLT
jgi:prophage maintenance system killer protein